MAAHALFSITSRLFQQADFPLSDPRSPEFRPIWRCRRFSLRLVCADEREITLFLFSPPQGQAVVKPKIKYMIVRNLEEYDLSRARAFMERTLMDEKWKGRNIVVLPEISTSEGPLETRVLIEELQAEFLHPLELTAEKIKHRDPSRKTPTPLRPMSAARLIVHYPRLQTPRAARAPFRLGEQVVAAANVLSAYAPQPADTTSPGENEDENGGEAKNEGEDEDEDEDSIIDEADMDLDDSDDPDNSAKSDGSDSSETAGDSGGLPGGTPPTTPPDSDHEGSEKGDDDEWDRLALTVGIVGAIVGVCLIGLGVYQRWHRIKRDA